MFKIIVPQEMIEAGTNRLSVGCKSDARKVSLNFMKRIVITMVLEMKRTTLKMKKIQPMA